MLGVPAVVATVLVVTPYPLAPDCCGVLMVHALSFMLSITQQTSQL